MQNFVWFEIGAFESFWSKILHGKMKFRFFVKNAQKRPDLKKWPFWTNRRFRTNSWFSDEWPISYHWPLSDEWPFSDKFSQSQKFNFRIKMNKFWQNFEKSFFVDRLIDLEWNLSILELIHMLLLIKISTRNYYLYYYKFNF